MSKPKIDAPGPRDEGDAAARLVVDLAALAGNYRAIASLAAAEVAGVVKANGYGLGAPEAARALHGGPSATWRSSCSCRASATRRTSCRSTA